MLESLKYTTHNFNFQHLKKKVNTNNHKLYTKQYYMDKHVQ